MDGVDDLGVVDALQSDRGDAEIAMAELALDHINGTPSLASYGVRVKELVGCEASPDARPSGGPAQVEPRLQLVPAPGIHADLAPPAALATPHRQRAAALIEVGLGERECFLDE
jgi:hypothetical protein